MAVSTVPRLMGIDLGAGSLKATIIGVDGVVLGSASSPVRTESKQPGWAEQDPEEWYQSLCNAVPAAISEANIDSAEIKAVSFSAGAHTPVLLDKNDRLIRPAIMWSDQRSGAESRELENQFGDEIRRIGFNSPNPTWTLPQLKWLKRNEPDAFARIAKIMVAKDYLRFRISGAWQTDRVDAVGTLFADAQSQTWSEELCAMADIEVDLLPPIVNPVDQVGTVSRRAADDTGLSTSTLVIAGTMDTAVECYGAGAVKPGQGVIKLATAGTVSVVTDHLAHHNEVIDYPHVLPGFGFTITGTNSCASAHRWLRDQFFTGHAPGEPETDKTDAFDVMERLASTIPPGSNGLLFHPYLQGERSPYWDPKLRADFIGITMQHTRGHFVRAMYEGIAFSLLDCLESLRTQGLQLLSTRIIGGGTRSKTWREIVCNVIGSPIEVPENGDASYGAALIAGVGAGVFSSELDAVDRCVKITERIEPNRSLHEFYQEVFSIYKESQAKLAAINHRITDMQDSIRV